MLRLRLLLRLLGLLLRLSLLLRLLGLLRLSLLLRLLGLLRLRLLLRLLGLLRLRLLLRLLGLLRLRLLLWLLTLLLRLRFRFGLDGFAPSEVSLNHLISVLFDARETILNFNLALVQKVDNNLSVLIEFVSHVVDSILSRF